MATKPRLTMKVLEARLEKAQNQINTMKKRASKQQRFTTTKSENMFWNIYKWAKMAESEEPPYSAVSAPRDAWLRAFVMTEPFLNGVLANVVAIDRNRGWTLIGADSIVKKYVDVLHSVHAAPDQIGWRPFLTMQSQAYHAADIGAISEIEWAGKRLYSLYSVDPTLCRLTGNNEKPLEFNDTLSKQGKMEWSTSAYFRIADEINTDQSMNGLGVCAVSRCLELAKIMVALYDHDKEKLLARAPKGLLLLKGISEKQWLDTLEARDTQMSALERKYYQGVQVLASMTDDVKAEMISLSSIPEGLSHETFTNIIMYLYALAFKYDPREFWPVSGGQLGTATETETQHKKATGKGGVDFSLAFQENLQDILPQTVEFEFEARDVAGEQADQSLNTQIINNIITLVPTILSVEQARILLAENEIIPKEWAATSNQIATDKEDVSNNPDKFFGGKKFFDEEGKAFFYDERSHQFFQEDGTEFFDQQEYKQQVFFGEGSVFFREAIRQSLYYLPDEPIMRYRERNGKGRYSFVDIPPDVKKRLAQHKFVSIAKPKQTKRVRDFSFRGGPGSGNYGHEGRPGEIGGSGAGEGISAGNAKSEDMKAPTNMKLKTQLSSDQNGWVLGDSKVLQTSGENHSVIAESLLKENGINVKETRDAATKLLEMGAIRIQGFVPPDIFGEKPVNKELGIEVYDMKKGGYDAIKDMIFTQTLINIPENLYIIDYATKSQMPISTKEFLSSEGVIMAEGSLMFRTSRGGVGSGNYGHAGVPGQLGGSAPSDSSGDKGESKYKIPASDSLKPIEDMMDNVRVEFGKDNFPGLLSQQVREDDLKWARQGDQASNDNSMAASIPSVEGGFNDIQFYIKHTWQSDERGVIKPETEQWAPRVVSAKYMQGWAVLSEDKYSSLDDAKAWAHDIAVHLPYWEK